jgi:hypothetical protein
MHYSLGRSIKSNAKFVDPSKLNDGWKIEHERINLDDLKKLLLDGFTAIPEQITENIDDYNDIAWFIILLWSLISSVIAYFLFSVPVFCIMSIFVLAFVSLMTFYNGYQSSDFEDLRDDFKHLEFFILSRLSMLQLINKISQRSLFIELISKDEVTTLNDLGISIRISQADDEDYNIDYYIGFPSLAKERFEFRGSWSFDSATIEQLKELASKSDWSLELDSSGNMENISNASFPLHFVSTIDLDDIEVSSNQILEFFNLLIDVCSKQKS